MVCYGVAYALSIIHAVSGSTITIVNDRAP